MNTLAISDASTSFFEQVESRLDEALCLSPDNGDAASAALILAARELCLAADAKRVRPRLVELFGRALQVEQEALVDVAVAGELIHSGSLLHDDVVDDGRLRRGRPTANARWGNTAAVLAGDLCLTLAFVQIASRPRSITDEAVRCIASMTRAAMAEAEARGRLEIEPGEWRRIAEGKTGMLFAWCAGSAARLAGDPEAVRRFERCGRHLGVAFQLTDDVLDLVGGSHKDRFSDIRNREPSLPLILACRRSPALASRLGRLWQSSSIDPEAAEQLGREVLDHVSPAEASRHVEREVVAALEALGEYSGLPGCREVAGWAHGLRARLRQEAAS